MKQPEATDRQDAMRLQAHAVLDILPPLSDAERERAAESVRLYGQRDPIEVVNGHIIAGLAEYDACLTAGIAPKVVAIDPPGCLIEYALRRNVPRHLSTLDRACVAVLAQDAHRGLARERQRLGGQLRGEVRDQGSRTPLFEGGRWWQTAAGVVGTTPGAVRALANIHRKAPDVFEAVRARKLRRLTDAKHIASFEEIDDRAAIIEGVVREGKPATRVAFRVQRDHHLRDLPDAPTKARRYEILPGRLEEVGPKLLPDHFFNAMYADIIYGHVPMAEAVARLGARVLVRGGILALVVGNEDLAEIILAITKHMALVTIGSIHVVGGKVAIRGRVERVDCLPVLFLTQFGARLRRPIAHLTFVSNQVEKEWHSWQKNLASTEDLLGSIVDPGGVVLDPCCGSSTAGVAAMHLGCRFVGIDCDEVAAKASRARLAEAERDLEVGNMATVPDGKATTE